jgi:hypothetical protein
MRATEVLQKCLGDAPKLGSECTSVHQEIKANARKCNLTAVSLVFDVMLWLGGEATRSRCSRYWRTRRCHELTSLCDI